MPTTKQLPLGSSSDDDVAMQCIDIISMGDENCRDLLIAVWNFEQTLDDLVDQDKPVGIEQAAKHFVAFVREISFNPFWLEHSWQLFPLLASAANRWCDAEEMPTGEARKVVRCGDIDFFLQAAYCRGGWEHMRAVRDARRYDEE